MESISLKAVKNGKVVRITISEGDIIRSYRGRRGCMCGCRGSYSDDPRLGIRRIRRIIKITQEEGTLPELDRVGRGWALHLPPEVEERRDVNYTVYLSNIKIV